MVVEEEGEERKQGRMYRKERKKESLELIPK